MIFTTSICANYAPKAAALARSLKEFHPNSQFVLCLVERFIPDEIKSIPYFDKILLGTELGIPNFDNFIFRHSIVEASTAVKGHLMKQLIESYQSESSFVYVDPDCLAFSRFSELEEVLKTEEIVLAPHLLSPGNIDMEISCLKHGVFNLGFLGLKRGVESSAFVNWWADRLYSYCFDDICNGLFTDQKWINLAPCFFNIHILKHNGYDYGTWNFKERKLTTNLGSYYANGEPLRFIHYSGFDSGTFLWAANEWSKESLPIAQKLDTTYREKLAECKLKFTPKWSYATYKNGKRVKNWHRKCYRKTPISTENPFEMSTTPFWMIKLQLSELLGKLKRTLNCWS